MSDFGRLVEEVSAGIRHIPAVQRDAVLLKVVQFFSRTAARYTRHDIDRLDVLLGEFVDLIEAVALAKIAFYLAEVPNAPPGVICRLGLYDDIVVSGPVLARSHVLTEPYLLAVVGSKGPLYLRAISEREWLSEKLTDALLDRGDRQVLHSVVQNRGARFSEHGVERLVSFARTDEVMAGYVVVRDDIPRAQVARIIGAASAEVREKLIRLNPQIADIVAEAVSEAEADARKAVATVSRSLDVTRCHVMSLFRTGSLGDEIIVSFARAKKFDEVLVALALLARIDVDEAERTLTEGGTEPTLVLAKAAGLSWNTTKAILVAREGSLSAQDMDNALVRFSRVSRGMARRVVLFKAQAKTGVSAAEITEQLTVH